MDDGAAVDRAMPVLRDYAFIADGWRGVVVGPGGEHVWLCFPSWHDPAVLGQLIGSGGTYVVRPRERFVWGGYYEEGSLIWRSRWVTNDGIVECREAMALPSGPNGAVVLRRLVGVAGTVAIDVVVDVRGDYGRTALNRWKGAGRSWTASKGQVHARWTGAAGSAVRETDGGHRLEQSVRVAEGDQFDLVLELATDGRWRDPPPDAAASWAATARNWASQVPASLDVPGERDVRQSVAVLHGLMPASGGLAAAATMSLPERARQGRNYDYRYSWIRDCCYAGHGLASIGDLEGLASLVRFIVARVLDHGPRLRPAYLVSGGLVPTEDRLDLPGYPGGTDVVGNRAGDQFQLDTFGEILLLLAVAEERGCLGADGWEAARLAAEAIGTRWEEPDAGVWEIQPKRWTHSRLICASGLRRIGGQQPPGPWAGNVLALADVLTASAAQTATHPSGRWQRAPDDGRVDAALLAVVARSALPDDPRMVRTVDAVVQDLMKDGYVFRYRAGSVPLGQAEGAFLMCSHLLTLAALRTGRRELAVRTFERARAACGPPGLYAEEFDVGERQLRGNLPQSFVHGLLIEAAAAQTADGVC